MADFLISAIRGFYSQICEVLRTEFTPKIVNGKQKKREKENKLKVDEENLRQGRQDSYRLTKTKIEKHKDIERNTKIQREKHKDRKRNTKIEGETQRYQEKHKDIEKNPRIQKDTRTEKE